MGKVIQKIVEFFEDDSLKATDDQSKYVAKLIDQTHRKAVDDGTGKNTYFIVTLDSPPADLGFPPGGLVAEIKRQTARTGAKLELIKFEPPRKISFIRKR